MAAPTPQELAVIQRMIDAGESTDNIKAVVEHMATLHPTKVDPSEPDTWWGGFFHSLRPGGESDQAALKGATGFVKGLPGGVAAGAGALVHLPVDVLQGVIGAGGDIKQFANNPDKFVRDLKAKYKDMPASIVKTLDNAVELAKSDPEAFGKLVGQITGGVETGVATSKIVPMLPKPLARTVGSTVEAIGKRAEFPMQIAGAHRILSGDPIQAAMMLTAPSAMQKTGKAIRVWGGQKIAPAEQAAMEAKFADSMANRNVSAFDERAKDAAAQAKAAAKAPPPSGTRDIPFDPATAQPISLEPAVPGQPEPGAPLVGTPAEASGRVQKIVAAEKKANDAAQANADKLAKIQADKEGLVAGKPSVSESTSAVDANGTRVSSRTPFKPAEAVGAEGSGFPGLSKEEVAGLRKQNYADADIQKISDGLAKKAPAAPVRVAAPKPDLMSEVQADKPPQAFDWPEAGVRMEPDAAGSHVAAPIRIASKQTLSEKALMDADRVSQIGGRAKSMGDSTVDSLRGAGYDVPATGIRTQADIDRIAAGPRTSFDRAMSETRVPDDLSFEGQEGVNPPPPTIGGKAPSATVPDEWMAAVNDKMTASRTSRAKSPHLATPKLSANDALEAQRLYMQDPTLSPDAAVAQLEQMKRARGASYRSDASLSALERQMLDREPE